MNVRIEGLYDKRTIDFLIENHVHHFGFNFSPKNINFLQHKEFSKILVEKCNSHHTYYMNVSYDSPLVINHLIQKVSGELESLGHNSSEFPLFLEMADEDFSRADEIDYRKTRGIFWHYRPDVHSLRELLKIPHLAGVFLNYSDIEAMHENETLFSFIQNFMHSFYKGQKDLKNPLVLGLTASWESDFFPSLFDLFDFDLISFGVGPEVEVCFRNVDLAKIGHSLGHIRQLSLL